MKKIIYILLILLLPIIGFAQGYKDASGIAFSFSLPTAYDFSYYDYELQKESNRGAIGPGLSLIYKNKKNKLSAGAGVFYFPSDDAFNLIAEHFGEDSGTEKKISGEFIDVLYQGNIFKGLSLIAGVNFVNYHSSFRDFGDPGKNFKKDDKTIGLAAGIDYMFFGRFGIMVLYRPAVVSFNKKQYWHLISFQLHYDIFRKF